MTRGLSAANVTEAAKATIFPVWLVYLDVSGDPLWAWTGNFDIQVTAAADPLLVTTRTFVATYQMGEISDISQDSDGAMQRVTLAITEADFQADAGAVSFISAPADWNMRTAVIWMAFLNESTGALVSSPFRLMSGRMDNARLVDGKGGGISIEIISKKVDGKRANGWRLTDAHQQRLFAGDRACEYPPYLVNQDMKFGQKGTFFIPGMSRSGGYGGGDRAEWRGFDL